jgi:lytic murein transglycosylase
MAFLRIIASFTLTFLTASPVFAAGCGSTAAGFDQWVSSFKQQAVKSGIGQKTVNSALSGVSYDTRVIRLDRNQKHFKQSFDVFMRNRVTAARVARGRSLLKSNSALFSRIEKRFGVPGPVLVAIWGLETDYGANTGSMGSIRSLATLAYDCRRSAMFTNELIAALKIVSRGDMGASSMRGGWAGEIGQTQFMPSKYVTFAVDFDGDGRRDLIRSRADVLASTANYLKGYGWQAGEKWSPGSSNFGVIQQWNKSSVYTKTVAYFASKLAGSTIAEKTP